MSKPSIASFRYSGEQRSLKDAITSACNRMELKIKLNQTTNDGFCIVAKEKIRILSTNWPIEFKISTQKVDQYWAVVISAKSSLTSLTQETNNHQKAQELSMLIKTLLPGECI